ncbi:MAG: anti-sigma factor [Acidimicrobiia bacterium]|nr:anti-sigma factor [Acidimicrobiia bacterium]
MARHLEACPSCRSVGADLDAQRLVLADPRLWEEPSDDLGSQITALVASGARHGDYRRRIRWLRPLSVATAIAVIAFGFSWLVRRPTPDWTAQIDGTALAAGAAGTVDGWNEDGGTRLRIRVSGLEPAGEGFVYEFWLSDGPLHISAGTFLSAEDVELWAGVRRSDFPRLWVTLEPIDKDESPSDATVLDAAA